MRQFSVKVDNGIEPDLSYSKQKRGTTLDTIQTTNNEINRLKARVVEFLEKKREEIIDEFYEEYCMYIFSVDPKKRDFNAIKSICSPFKHRLSLILNKFIEVLLTDDKNYAIPESEKDIDYALRLVIPAKNIPINNHVVLKMVKSFNDMITKKILKEINLSKHFVSEEKVKNILNEIIFIIFNDLWVSCVVGFRYQHSVIQALLGKLIRVQEDERQKLHGEIHDELLQVLALIIVKLEIIEELSYHDVHALRNELSWLSKKVKEATNEIKNVCHDFNLSWIEKRGLGFSLNAFVKRFEKEFQIPVLVEICKDIEKLKGYPGITLFRIIQEALFNAGKHSKANFVRVNINIVDRIVSVLIEDKGIGFDLKKMRRRSFSKNNFGLILMAQRVQFLNGSLEISSKKKFGTMILIKIPLSILSRKGL
jgi:signal transduction histidine kinase